MATLQVTGLSGAGFGPVDLEVAAGRCIGLAGHSGSGKSQIMRAIADLEPNSGSVLLDGREREAWTAPEWRCRVALLPAEPQWWGSRVDEHFPHGLPLEWLGRVGLSDNTGEREVARLSTGERQRLALLRVLALRPAVLLLDEPTSNLDGGSERRIEALMAEYRAESGAAAIWVSHDEEQLTRVADCSYRIRDGQLAETCGSSTTAVPEPERKPVSEPATATTEGGD